MLLWTPLYQDPQALAATALHFHMSQCLDNTHHNVTRNFKVTIMTNLFAHQQTIHMHTLDQYPIATESGLVQMPPNNGLAITEFSHYNMTTDLYNSAVCQPLH